MKKIVIAMLLLHILLSSAHSAGTVKIGASLGLTGKYEHMSNMQKNAYLLWEKHINENGGLLGKKVKLIIYDDQSEPGIARKLYSRLISKDRVDLILAPYSSAVTMAVLPVTEKFKYPLLASGAAADKLWQMGYKYAFGVFIPTSRYSQGFLELMLRNGLKDTAIVFADDPFSMGIAEGTRKWALRFGMNILMFKKFKKGTRNLDDIARKVRNSGAQVVIVGGHLNESIDMRLSLKKIKWMPRAYYASSGPATQKYYDVLKDDAEFTFSSSQWEPKGVSAFPGAERFTKEFLSTYKVEPTYHASSAYAAGQILEAAVKSTGSLNRERLRNVLSSLDTMTIMGRYGVDRTGVQIRHIALIVQWQKREKHIVAPEEFSTSKAIFNEITSF